LKHPVTLASGPWSADSGSILKAARSGASCIQTKTSTIEEGTVPIEYVTVTPGGMMNIAPWWSDLDHKQWLKEIEKTSRAKVPIIASIVSPRKDPQEIAQMAEDFAKAGANGIQLPLGSDQELAAQYVKVARKTGLPVWAKLAIGERYDLFPKHLASYGKKLEEAGANALVAIDAVTSGLKINVDRGEPDLGTPDGLGRMSGPAIHAMAVHAVNVLHNAVKIPILGVGGIMSGRDAMEMMMAGASAVGVCTAAVLGGPTVPRMIATEFSSLMKKKRYRSAKDIVGVGNEAILARQKRAPERVMVTYDAMLRESGRWRREYRSMLEAQMRLLR
jgi:dihydroorotate dehydrogenase